MGDVSDGEVIARDEGACGKHRVEQSELTTRFLREAVQRVLR